MILWAIRNKYGNIKWFKDKPIWNKRQGKWQGLEIADIYDLDGEFDDITFDDSPVKYELKKSE